MEIVILLDFISSVGNIPNVNETRNIAIKLKTLVAPVIVF